MTVTNQNNIKWPIFIYISIINNSLRNADIIRSPEDELARLFHSPTKRDSTYSSMSDASNGSTYDLSSSSQRLTGSSHENSTTHNSPVTNLATPETPGTSSPESTTSGNMVGIVVPKNSQEQQGESPTFSTSSTIMVTSDHLPTTSTTSDNPSQNNQRAAAAALAAEAVAAANQRQSSHSIANIRQPFFTFALKYEEDNNLVRIDFIVSNVFVTLFIFPHRRTDFP